MSEPGDAAAYEQFCLLAKTARGRACAALIQQVLASKKVFVFGELLAMPTVQELRGTEHEAHLVLLEMFAYGKHSEYASHRTSGAQPELPDLTEPQLHKLRLLSIVALAAASKEIPYAVLQAELGLDNVRVLEDTIIDAMYAGLIKGRLDQRAAILRVRRIFGRDVRVDELPRIIAALREWRDRCVAVGGGLEASGHLATLVHVKDEAEIRDAQQQLESVKTVVRERVT
eukprot:CAMPEP_0198419916 /NCGR_PEP_ID=MMETSP1452-20131203/516_1 /TAXON_ID=1181717 /ORGANISM="Synchroma pusillum, Strain CCMP3072" /LENGTH=228 /DNA_ID=CAMNT_0044140055 /DNA_START=27 /DNA_END=709 /DNA_ORIENTATION=+